MNMKTILLGILIMTFLVGCSSNQNVTMSDNEYFGKITSIMDEYEGALDEVTPKFEEYIKDTTKYKELNVPAEKAYAKIQKIRKRIEKVKPVDDDWKSNQGMLVTGLKYMEESMKFMIRLSNTGNEDLKNNVAASANYGFNNLKVMENFKEQLPK